MPIRPENFERYPKDWSAISAAIRVRSGGRCECDGRCGRHVAPCMRRHGAGIPSMDPSTMRMVVLTTAHLDHTPANCDPENLMAMCQRCHLAYDAEHHAATRRLVAEAARRHPGQLAIDGIEPA